MPETALGGGPPERVLVLDFGAQYAQLIARRVRELGVYAEIRPFSTPWEEIQALRPSAVILSGGPASVYAPGAPLPDPRLLQGQVPILGICYGMQAMARLLGGDVRPAEAQEYGRTSLTVTGPSVLFRGLGPTLTVWMSHADSVRAVPPGFRVVGSSPQAPVAAMEDPEARRYAVQFHPEVAHTPDGREILRRFLYEVAGCRGGWSMGNFVSAAVEKIREQIGGARAVVALSGGVDSAVAAALVERAIGRRLVAVFVDHGLLREGEGEAVASVFRPRLGDSFRWVHAEERFLSRLRGVTDPEEKRRRIGEEFVRVFEEEARRAGEAAFLVQGTLYPDVVESGPGAAQVIKSHHNVGGLPADMTLGLVEPLRELFKDEVRALGRELGLPEEIVARQPFPGPGLAVRMVGEVTRDRLALLRQADRVVREEVEAAGLASSLWQYFAVLPGVRSVGVMGDGRTYGETVVVRAVTSEDGMTADWARLPHDLLDRIASRLVSEVRGVNRVVYDVTSKPPGTIEWE